MVATPIAGAVYFGHDELSTAWPLATVPGYSGTFMADDFADKFNTPVVHLSWWGSYLNETTAARRVSQFLISFESDVPADATGRFSHPGVALFSEIVNVGPLGPASGTFTETLVRGPDPLLNEALYKYNAELALPFNQKPDTVYWLKIVALDTVQQQSPDAIHWGWHNRDYTIPDPLASTPPAVSPGESVVGVLPDGQLINHFQDDAVSGNLTVIINPTTPPNITVDQTNYAPRNYVLPYDGPPIIDQFSKDLAFSLYTVPEPNTVLMLLGACIFGINLYLRRRRVA